MLYTPYFFLSLTLVAVFVAGASASVSVVEDAAELVSRPQTQAPTQNLFKEYLTRGLYTCASNYVATLTKLHKLIKEAAEEHRRCSGAMANAPKTYTQTENAYMNAVIDEYQEEDKNGGASTQQLRL